MKKLLYTLFAFAIIVACEKDMDENYDASSINPIEAEVVAGNLEARFDAFNDFLRGATFTPVSKEKGSASTARGGDNGADWIELIWFTSPTDNYVYTNPEDLGNACFDNIGTGVTNVYRETYSYRASTQMVNIQVGEGTGVEFPIPSDLQALYQSAFGDANSALYFANLDGTTWTFREGNLPTGTNFDFSCSTPGTNIIPTATGGTLTSNEVGIYNIAITQGASVTISLSGGYSPEGFSAITGSAFGLDGDLSGLAIGTHQGIFSSRRGPHAYTVYINVTVTAAPGTGITWTPGSEVNGMTMVTSSLGSYRLEAAPFPLTGMLATMVTKTGDAASRTVLNYAGTDTPAVRAAIERSFAGQ